MHWFYHTFARRLANWCGVALWLVALWRPAVGQSAMVYTTNPMPGNSTLAPPIYTQGAARHRYTHSYLHSTHGDELSLHPGGLGRRLCQRRHPNRLGWLLCLSVERKRQQLCFF